MRTFRVFGMMSQTRSGKSGFKPRRIVVRTCIGCHETGPKRRLIRIVRSPAGVRVDSTGKQAGRGAYMHARRACWEHALQGQQVARALRMEIGLQDWQRLHAHAATLPDDESQKVSR